MLNKPTDDMNDTTKKTHTKEKQYIIPSGVNILEYLRSKDIFIPAPCGGAGTCGKCKIRLIAGCLPDNGNDRALLSDDEIYSGLRLACRSNTNMPVRIQLFTEPDKENFSICTDHGNEQDHEIDLKDMDSGHEYGIAIDLGTTTIAAEITDITENVGLITRASVNRQRTFGADVVSRIEAAASGRGEELKRIIEKDLCDLVESMGISSETRISKVVISGNTTMYHLLMEYDVSGIASFPFSPVSLGGEWFLRDEVFSLETVKRKVLPQDCRIYLMPGLGAFVGGDIFSGMYATGITRDKGVSFFIDIGTNAEMVLKKEDMYFTTSAAAGPALEGGNLKWGTGSVAGAISGVTANTSGFGIKTISDAAPVGICGTGAIEAVYELLRAGILDRYGTFAERYRDHGFPLAKSVMGEIISLDQDDIRQIQMAKAAIRAGAEALMKHAGVSADEVDRVYVSGGFGSYLDMKKAAGTGLLPEGLLCKAQATGNTSLKGAQMALSDGIRSSADEEYQRIMSKTEPVDLANDEWFKERYIECMNFE